MAFRYFRRKPALQNNGLLLLQIATRFSKLEENTSPNRRLFLTKGVTSWITLHSYTLGLMYASVHLLLQKKRNLLFIAKYFIFYDFSRKYLCKTWWYHESFRNPMDYFRKLHHTINDINVFIYKNWCQGHYWCQDHNWLKSGH